MENTTFSLHPRIAQMTTARVVESVLSPFDLTYRLHTSLGRETWAKLWYCLRALDQSGRGHIKFPIAMLEALTGGDEKSIYRWLKDGRRWGAFRAYRCRKGILSIWMQSLFKCCIRLNIKDWGAVSEENLLQIRNIRPQVTATVTQKLQQRSRYAASSKLKPQRRKLYPIPHPNELVPEVQQPSLKCPKGEISFVLHISSSRVFVSKGFACFGTSQRTIAKKLSLHPVTVQRHLAAAGVQRRQICQAKSEYANLYAATYHNTPEWECWMNGGNKHIGYSTVGDVVQFRDGIPLEAKKQFPNSWKIPAGEFKNRFFRMGEKTWMAKCNVYREDKTLKAMWAARSEFKQQVALCQFHKKPGVALKRRLQKQSTLGQT